MSKDFQPAPIVPGQAFRDSEGQRWWVRGPRPGPGEQFVIEAEMKGSYPRVALYVMTEPEFRAHARAAQLQPEQPGRASGPRGERPGR
ncbi:MULTISPECIES: hypothetical protein [Ramlibacter]|uniref:Uncharacterized protein n=1 Tax=Ramlibacter aquaticus TaxID=2780094 RepID=A0ABR9SEE9_9BURK|nr:MULTISPECIES: hypothetical protein [Ramlibacter]MBE7940655.1 hypothetical protein [Ramlibacter aquaticus]